MNLKDFKHDDWATYWAGSWSILSFSYWGSFYTGKKFTGFTDRYLNSAIIIWEDGKSACYQRKDEKDIFGNKIAKFIIDDKKAATTLCQNLKNETDNFLRLMEDLKGKDISFEEYKKFQDTLLYNYYPKHIQNKVLVDYLPSDILEKLLPQFEEARLYSEPVFTKTEEFIIELAQIHSKKTGYDPRLILCCVDKEFEAYLKKGEDLPSKDILVQRCKSSALLFKNGKLVDVIVGEEFKEVEEILKGKEEDALKGQTGYPGKVRGKVKLVFDPSKSGDFSKGDILVTGMTRPEYVPIIKKSAAVITDGGGVLCHAAIVAREMKIPTIIGTQKATKFLKDGDEVEVDAEKGIVKKI